MKRRGPAVAGLFRFSTGSSLLPQTQPRNFAGALFAATQRPTGLPTGPQNPSSVSLRGAMAMGRWHRSRAQLSRHPRPTVMPLARKRITSLEALGRKDQCIQRMHFHARTDALRERLDARQAQICGGGASGGSGATPGQDSAGQGGQSSWPKARGGQGALAAAPVGKKVPATVTAGTEVWGSLAPQ
jgi:hypothetical protein